MNDLSSLTGIDPGLLEVEDLSEQFHLLSGKIVEKCAEAETHVVALLRAQASNTGISPKAPLACKMKALRAASEQREPTKQESKLLSLLNDLEPLADLRTEIAHSVQSWGWLDGRSTVVLKNAADQHSRVDRRVVIALDELKDAHRELSSLANQFSQLVATYK